MLPGISERTGGGGVDGTGDKYRHGKRMNKEDHVFAVVGLAQPRANIGKPLLRDWQKENLERGQ
jgi:hypothetical protein